MEIVQEKKNHPLIIHFGEAHQEKRQEMRFRVIKMSRIAVERQVWESVEIDDLVRKPSQCFSPKTKFGRSQTRRLI